MTEWSLITASNEVPRGYEEGYDHFEVEWRHIADARDESLQDSILLFDSLAAKWNRKINMYMKFIFAAF